MKLHLVADVLDEQLQDVQGRNAGRVDGIVLELREGKPPRVAYLEISPITLLSRFSRRLARRYAPVDARLGEGRGFPFRLPWSRVTRDGPLLRMDLRVDATPIDALERWLRRVVVDRVPGMH